MKETKTIPKKDGFDYSKLLKKVIIAVAVIAIFIVLLATGQILFLLQIFGWIENQVRTLTGLDMMLVKGITAVLLSLILILPIGGFILSFFPIPQKNKKIKQFAVIAIFALLFFASYFSSSNVFFDPVTGAPLKYYSINPRGEYKFYSSNGYDPLTGDSLRSINKEVVINYLGNPNGRAGIPENFEPAVASQRKKSLTGLEKYAGSYPVKFKNKTGRNIFICINMHDQDSSFLSARFIPVGGIIILELKEGLHIFGYMDTDGCCYGERNWGDLLLGTNMIKYLGKGPPFINWITNRYDQDYVPRIAVKINNQNYKLTRSFILDVLPENDQIITLKVDKLIHNKEIINRGSFMFFAFQMLLILAVCSLSYQMGRQIKDKYFSKPLKTS